MIGSELNHICYPCGACVKKGSLFELLVRWEEKKLEHARAIKFVGGASGIDIQ